MVASTNNEAEIALCFGIANRTNRSTAGEKIINAYFVKTENPNNTPAKQVLKYVFRSMKYSDAAKKNSPKMSYAANWMSEKNDPNVQIRITAFTERS